MEVNKLCQFESSVNSYDSQTICEKLALSLEFESSVNSYDSQTEQYFNDVDVEFESSVNSYDSQTNCDVVVLA
mgnify:CR=1 FL=1